MNWGTQMNNDRRLVLKSLAAAGLAVSGVSFAHAGRPVSLRPVAPDEEAVASLLAVTSHGGGAVLNAAFLAGIEAASSAMPFAPSPLPAMQLRGLDAEAFVRLDALLKDGEQTMLVGLIDDAAAMLVLDLVRSAGGQVLAVQHHRVGSGPHAVPWAQALGRALVAGTAATSPFAGAGAQACVSFRCVI